MENRSLLSPYRELAELDELPTEPYAVRLAKWKSFHWKAVVRWNTDYACPACGSNNRTYENGKPTKNFVGCLGKKSFFGRQKCPPHPHLHVRCWACELKFAMWSEET